MSNQQPVVDVNEDTIIAAAKKAYEEFEKYKSECNDPWSVLIAGSARKTAELVPELLRLLVDKDEQNQLLKQENEDHLIAREHLSNQLASNLELLYEKEY